MNGVKNYVKFGSKLHIVLKVYNTALQTTQKTIFRNTQYVCMCSRKHGFVFWMKAQEEPQRECVCVCVNMLSLIKI